MDRSVNYMVDDKNSEHDGYIYQSTLEEGADLKAFHLELIDQMIESYNHHGSNVFTSFGDSEESRFYFNILTTFLINIIYFKMMIRL